jgi:hypothetical protein
LPYPRAALFILSERRDRHKRSYSIAAYAVVQKSVNTFGGSGESIMRCVKRMPIIAVVVAVRYRVPSEA